MKCCGSFLCRPCFDYALIRYEQCSFCSLKLSEYTLKDVSPNDGSLKMKTCGECDENVPEEDFGDHKKCTKALVSEYEDKLAQQRFELEKSYNLKMLKLELKNKLALRKIATKARKSDEENEELRKKIAEEEATKMTLLAEISLVVNSMGESMEKIAVQVDILDSNNKDRQRKLRSDLEELTQFYNSQFHDRDVLISNLQEENRFLQNKTDNQRQEINGLRGKLGYFRGPHHSSYSFYGNNYRNG